MFILTPSCCYHMYSHVDRGVQDNDRYLREAWFMDVRACRRRVQGPITGTPVARMFALPDEYHLLDYRATIMAVKRYLKVSEQWATTILIVLPHVIL